jgi:hypothetical protein
MSAVSILATQIDLSRYSDEDRELLRDTFDDLAVIGSASEDSDGTREQGKLCSTCRRITVRSLKTLPGYQHTTDYSRLVTATRSCSMCRLILCTLRQSDHQFDQHVQQVYRNLEQHENDDSNGEKVSHPFSITLFACLPSESPTSVDNGLLFAHASLHARSIVHDIIGKFKLYDCYPCSSHQYVSQILVHPG